jgi:hypothetical protein
VGNICFQYLYRDASNFKRHRQVVFANPGNLPVDSAREQLGAGLDEGQYFIASQVRVPEVFLWSAQANYDPEHPPANIGPGQCAINEDDHSWHEFGNMTTTNAQADDEHGRTIEQFLDELKQAAAAGWQEFAPQELSPSCKKEQENQIDHTPRPRRGRWKGLIQIAPAV